MDDSFDFEDWLASVEGNTVRVTMADGLGYQANQLITKSVATEENMTLCPRCEDMRLLIDDGDVIGRCPVCGHNPRSALALGTRSMQAWDETPEEYKPTFD